MELPIADHAFGENICQQLNSLPEEIWKSLLVKSSRSMTKYFVL